MISGQVTDPSGAAIAGATVVATNVETNVKLTTTTGADGHYVLAQVPPGAYTHHVRRRRLQEILPHRA